MRCCQHTYPGDSDNGQYVSFTERQVLFVGSLEVVLGYTLCASRPRCLHHTQQTGCLVNHSDVTGFGLCFISISRRVMQLLGDGKHCCLRSGRFKNDPKGTTDLLKMNVFLRINTVSLQEISQIQSVRSFVSVDIKLCFIIWSSS